MTRGGEEVDHSLVDGPGLIVEPEQGQMGEEAKTLEVVEESGVQPKPLNVGAQFCHQLQVIRAQQLHGVEEDSLQPEHWEDGVRGIEIDVSEHIRHQVIDNMLETRDAIQEKGHTLWRDALKKAWHDYRVETSAAQEPGEARVGDISASKHKTFKFGTINADYAGNVIITWNEVKINYLTELLKITLFWQGEDPDVVEVFESVGEQVRADGGAVCPL